MQPVEMARSAGRQHGSFSCLSMLAEDTQLPFDAASVPHNGYDV
jgi:hypothetical protein